MLTANILKPNTNKKSLIAIGAYPQTNIINFNCFNSGKETTTKLKL